MQLPLKLRVSKIKGYSFYHHNDDIVIYDNDGADIEISPAEVRILSNLLNSIGGISGFRNLPSRISENPFLVRFDDKGKCFLTRDREDSGISFMVDDVDDIIKGIRDVEQKVIDIKKIRGGPNPGVQVPIPDPLIEGR
jgi:hypothetical protein